MLHTVTLAIALLAAAPQLKTYEAKADGFSVSLPGTPKVETDTEKGDDGPTTTRTYTLETDDGIYLISVLDDASMAGVSDPKEIDAIFEGFEGSISEGDKLVANKKITFGKYPGREFKTRGKNVDTTARVYLVDRHLYAVMVGWHRGTAAEAVGAQQYLDSFQLLGLSPVVATPAGKGAGKPIKATFTCYIIGKDGKSTKLSATSTAKISGEYISCAVTSKDERLLGNAGIIQTSWHKVVDGASKAFTGPEIHGEPNSEDNEYTYMFSLDDRHWAECASDLSVALTVDGKAGARFEQTLVFKQDCGGAAPKPAVVVAGDPNDDAVFAPGEQDKLAKLGGDAQAVATQWAEAFVNQDGAFLFNGFPKGGVKIGKAVVTKAKMQGKDPRDVTGLRPLFGCQDPKQDTTCRWDKWHVEVKGPAEFWLYNTDDSFYGPYRSMVFKKKGASWVWVAMADLDMGEP